MYNAEVLSDLRLHKHDIEAACPSRNADGTADAKTVNAMLDRLVRDLLPDSADKLSHTHGVKHSKATSLEMFYNQLLTMESTK